MTGRGILRPLLLAAAALAAAPPAARAGDADADAAFARGQRLEEALGDLEGALASYRSAAASEDAPRRAAALLRTAAVQRRLGRPADARATLQSLLDDAAAREAPGAREAAEEALRALGEPGPPPESPELKDLRERVRANEEELLRMRVRLKEALETSAEVDPLRAALQGKEKELEAVRAKLQAAERSARGGPAEPTEREIADRRREDSDKRRLLSAEWTRYGRDAYRAGRFEEARKFLREAVDLDPENAVARDLLARVSAPNEAGEQLVGGILEVLAREQETRAELQRVEAAALVEEGRRLDAGGDPAGALEKYDAVLSRIDAHPDLLDRLEPVRSQAAALFDGAAKRAGSSRRAPPPPPATPAEDPRWQEAVRAILEKAGSAGEAGGASLRLFPLGPVVRAQRDLLPPSPDAGSAPRGFVLSGEVPPPGPLLQAALRGSVEPAAWRAPGAVLEGVGATLVARAGGKALEAVERAVAGLASPPSRSLLVRATAIPCDPPVLVAALSRAGVALSPLPRGTGAAALLDPAAAAAVLEALGGPGEAPADAVFRVPERRGFAVAALRPRGADAEEEAPGLRLQGIGWFLPDGSVATGALVACAVPGPAGAAEVLGAPLLTRQEAAVGGAVVPGGALLLAGMGNPFATGSGDRPHLAVLLRFGEGAAAAPGAPEEATVCPLGDLTARDPDVPGPLTPAAGDLRAARAEAVRRWVARRGQIGVEVRLEGNGIRVTGPSSARGLAVADLERLRNAREATRVEVRAYAMDPRTEASILRGLPIQSPGPEAAWRFARLAGDERKRALFLLEGVGGRLALSGEAAAGLSPGQRQGFARTEGTGEALAALEAGIRAWPGEVPGERALWIDLAVKRPADALPVRDSEARVAGATGTAHLFVGLPNPFPGAGERTRLAVWVEAVE